MHKCKNSKSLRLLLHSCVLAFVHFASSIAYGQVAQQPAPPQEPPRFRAGVELTTLDVAVVDDRGRPIAGLTPDDFAIRIDGNARKVVSAEWVPLSVEAGAPPPPPPPDGFSTNEHSTGGRLIVLAVDEPNIRFGGAMAIARAANAFVDRLTPADRVAVAGIGIGAPSTPFTADRQRIRQAISRMVGLKHPGGTAIDLGHNIGLAEALRVDRGDQAMLETIQERECAGLSGPPLISCRMEVEVEVRQRAFDARTEGQETTSGLRSILLALRGIEGAKTLVFVSEGFVLTDTGFVTELGSLAAAARTSLYVLRLDGSWFDASVARMPNDPFSDRQAQTESLDLLAGAARGTIFNVAGNPQALFERLEAELSGYYLIGVESDPRDRDGKSHPIRVDVPRKGAIVRTRRQMLNTPADRKVTLNRRQTAAAALNSPLVVSGLPLRVGTFALQGPERDRVQILIHADIGNDYASSKVATLAYWISDANGKVMANTVVDARLPPVMNGVPSALQYKTGASLPPGDYTLKLAAVEGERVGTVEHVIHAALPRSDALTFSELMVGGPLTVSEILQPTIGYQVTFGSVHGYFETYGKALSDISVEYEIGTDEASPALLNADVAPYPAGDERTIFTRVIPVHQLPPGKYTLRAIVSVNNRSIKTLTRGFEVAKPKVLMTAADGLGDSSPGDSQLFLPVDEQAIRPAFPRQDAVDPETLAVFRERTPVEVKDVFEQGVAFLAAADYPKAEAAFKRAIQPEIDSTPALAYLAVSFASAGRDQQAASAFQTALVDGDDVPQIYDWLGGTLMRNHEFAEARAMFEEAAGKWPADARFAKPLAMLYAMFGRGRQAVRTLERYLTDRTDDRDAYYVAVQWLYTLHSTGAIVHSRAQDVQLARDYAAAYEQASGPQVPLVRQWVGFLEGEKR
jgi:VWFA-related protein